MTPAAIIVAAEATIKAAGLAFPVRFPRQPKGWGWLAGAEVEIPAGAAAEWVEVSIMPRVDEEQLTSSPAALVGTERPQRLAYATYYGPDGPGSADAVTKAKSVLAVLAGDTIGDSSGGVYFEQGSGYQTLGTSGGRFQLQAWLRGLLLYSEAA